MGAWPLITVSHSCLLGGVGQQRLVLSHAVAHLEFAFHLTMSFAAWRVMFLFYPRVGFPSSWALFALGGVGPSGLQPPLIHWEARYRVTSWASCPWSGPPPLPTKKWMLGPIGQELGQLYN